MSASKQKQLRQTDSAALSRKEQERLKQKKQKQKTTLITVVVLVAVALLIAAMVFVNSKLIRRIMPAYSINGEDISVEVFEYYYSSVYSQLYSDASSTYGEFVSYIMPASISQTRSMSYDDTRSWHEYLLDETVDSISGVMYFNALAQAEGYTLTEDDLAQLDAVKASIEMYAQYSGLTVDEYLAQSFGKAISYEQYEAQLKKVILAESYRQHVRESFTYTEDETAAYYSENRDRLDYYSFRVTFLYASEQASYSTEAPENAMEELRAAWEEIQPAIEGGEDYYDALRPHLPETQQETFGEDDSALTRVQGSALNSDYVDWVTDASRKEGDLECIEMDDGIYILQYVSREDNDYVARDFYLMAYPVSVNRADYNSDEEYDTVLKMYIDNGSAYLNDYYLKWQQAGSTVEAFGQVAEEYSTQMGSGEVEVRNSLRGELGDVSLWLYDSARQPGDVTSIYCEELSAYCMVCYIGEGMRADAYIASEELRSEDYASWLNEQDNLRIAALTSEEKFWSRLIAR